MSVSYTHLLGHVVVRDNVVRLGMGAVLAQLYDADLVIRTRAAGRACVTRQVERAQKCCLLYTSIERLGRNECTMQTGIHFLDIVHDLEKISDHCSNIAIYTIQLAEGARSEERRVGKEC